MQHMLLEVDLVTFICISHHFSTIHYNTVRVSQNVRPQKSIHKISRRTPGTERCEWVWSTVERRDFKATLGGSEVRSRYVGLAARREGAGLQSLSRRKWGESGRDFWWRDIRFPCMFPLVLGWICCQRNICSPCLCCQSSCQVLTPGTRTYTLLK